MNIHCAYDKLVSLMDLKNHPKNANKHPKDQIERLAKILDYQGWRRPVRVSKRSGFITAGHGAVMAAKHNGWSEVPVNFQDYESEDQEIADLHADNAIGAWADLDLSQINLQIPDLGPDFDIDMLGLKDFEIEPADKYLDQKEAPKLSDRFLIPPFSVFNAREGWWQDRKRQWINMGIQSEIGRGVITTRSIARRPFAGL